MDNEDSDPLKKGIGGGFVGELSVVSYYNNSEVFFKGHSFLVYKSFVNDSLDVHNLAGGYSETQYNNHSVSHYEIKANKYITFGAWLDTKEFDSLSSLSNCFTNALPGEQTGGIYYNIERNYMITNPSSYYPNAALKTVMNNDQLNQLMYYLNDNNYYSLTNHNCSTVAGNAWNLVINDDLTASFNILSFWFFRTIRLAYIDLPVKLKEEILNRNYYVFVAGKIIQTMN